MKEFLQEHGLKILGLVVYNLLEFWFGRTDKTPAGSLSEFVLWKLGIVTPKAPEKIQE